MESEGLAGRFVPWKGFADPFDDFEFNEASDECFEYADPIVCSTCGDVTKQPSTCRFGLRNDTAQPLIHGTGTAFIHSNAKQAIEDAGYRGFRVVPYRNSTNKQTGQTLNDEYGYMGTSGILNALPGEFLASENTCPKCRHRIDFCSACGTLPSTCRSCKAGLLATYAEVKDEFGNTTSGSEWPANLSSWSLDDAVGGSTYWIGVTGQLLEFMIRHDIAPFAYVPIDVELDGASNEQIERAFEVRRVL